MRKQLLAALGLVAAMALSAGSAYAGDAANGEAVFNKKCKACHTADQGGKHKVGPNLFGIAGANAGTTDFARYKVLNGTSIVWTDENLDKFLADPDGFAGGKTKMKALDDAAARADVIAYLKTLK